MNRRNFLTSALALGALAALDARAADKGRSKADVVGRVVRSDEEWRRLLTPEQYEVTRQKGTWHLVVFIHQPTEPGKEPASTDKPGS